MHRSGVWAVVLATLVVLSGMGGYLLLSGRGSGGPGAATTSQTRYGQVQSQATPTVTVSVPGPATTSTVTSTSTSFAQGTTLNVTKTLTVSDTKTVTSVSTSTTTLSTTSDVTVTRMVSGELLGTGVGDDVASRSSASSSTTSTTSSTSSSTTRIGAGGSAIGLTVSAGTIASASSVAAPAGLPSGSVSPFGWWEFEVTGLTPGQTVLVTLTFTSPVPPGAVLYKSECGPSPGVYEAESLVKSVSGDALTIALTDGGAGDCDAVAGQITDPAGLAVLGDGPDTPPQGVPQFPFGVLTVVGAALPIMALLRRATLRRR